MSYLMTQIVLCLLLAALLGFIIGWALRAMSCNKKIAELEASWESRLAAAAGPAKEDLKRLEGIGPKIEKLLNNAEIHTWAELADTPVNRLKDILRRAGEHYRFHDPESWPHQAKLAAEGRWKELDEYQDVLLGGRES